MELQQLYLHLTSNIIYLTSLRPVSKIKYLLMYTYTSGSVILVTQVYCPNQIHVGLHEYRNIPVIYIHVGLHEYRNLPVIYIHVHVGLHEYRNLPVINIHVGLHEYRNLPVIYIHVHVGLHEYRNLPVIYIHVGLHEYRNLPSLLCDSYIFPYSWCWGPACHYGLWQLIN